MNQDLRSGVAAGLAKAINHIYHPFEVLKLRRQSHDGQTVNNLVPKHSKNTAKALLEIFRQEGLNGLYRGVTATFWISIGTYMIYFSVYERAKHAFATRNLFQDDKFLIFAASTSSGILTQVLTQPFWVIKTRLLLLTDSHAFSLPSQNEKLLKFFKSYNTAREIFMDHGWRGFYRGLTLSLVLVQQSSIQLGFYEYFLKHFASDSPNLSFDSILSGMAGVLGKIVSQALLSPVCIVRTRYQQKEIRGEDGNAKYNGYRDIAEKIWEKEGVHGFYKGLFAGLLRSLPSNGTFYALFHLFKTILQPKENEKH